MKKLFTFENMLRTGIVLALVVFASIKYEFLNVVYGLLIVFCMTLMVVSIVQVYQEVIEYKKNKQWNLTVMRMLFFVSLIILIPVLFLLYLPSSIKTYAFLIIGVVLLALLLYDLVMKLFNR